MIKPGVETYLGDGLYVSHDGYQLRLRADSQRVFLEPQVWLSLLVWVKRHASPVFPAGTEGSADDTESGAG